MTRIRYQYGVILMVNQTDERPVVIQPSKGIAETVARDWVISPARTARRKAYTVRRFGYTGVWEKRDTWVTPGSAEPAAIARGELVRGLTPEENR